MTLLAVQKPSFPGDIESYFTRIDEYEDKAINASMLGNNLQVGLLGLYLNSDK